MSVIWHTTWSVWTHPWKLYQTKTNGTVPFAKMTVPTLWKLVRSWKRAKRNQKWRLPIQLLQETGVKEWLVLEGLKFAPSCLQIISDLFRECQLVHVGSSGFKYVVWEHLCDMITTHYQYAFFPTFWTIIVNGSIMDWDFRNEIKKSNLFYCKLMKLCGKK